MREREGAGGGPPERPGALTRVLLSRLDDELVRDAFEPAFEELRAAALRSWRGGRRRNGWTGFWFRVRVFGLAVESVRLNWVRGGRLGSTRGGMMDPVWRDVRFAARALTARPLFTLVAVLTLALGMGANTAIFGVVNGLLLTPLPFREPGELVTVDVISTQGYGISISVPNHEDWRSRNRVFETFGAAADQGFRRLTDGGSEIVDAQMVIGAFFETLGVAPLLGRFIHAEETARGAAPVAVLSHRFWQSAFAGDPAVVGRTLEMGGMAHTIVGVMPPGFGYPTLEAQVYVPMGEMSTNLPWDDRRSSFGARAIARLSPGMTVEGAQRDMDRVTREVDESEGRPGSTAVVAPLAESYRGEARGPALVLMGAVVFVLLIAGVNVANLLLARGEDRRREVAVRAALGAGRGAITRQLLTESVLLATGGALVGLVVAAGSLALIRAYVPLPPLLGEAVRIDGRVLGFTGGLVVVVGLVFGALPALRVSASGPVLALREAGRGVAGPGRHRLRSVLVIAEVGLALVLLVASGLMIASLSRLRHVEGGFESGEMLTAMVPASTAGGASREQWRGFYDKLLERVNGEPGVTSAAATLLIPLAPRSWELRVQPEGVPYDPLEGASVLYNIISAGYFDTFGVPLVRGRDFTPSDRDDSAPVVIIDETLAAQYWPGEDPLGKRVAFEQLSDEEAGGAGPVPVYRTVVGVVPNVRHYELRNASRIQVYVPLHQTLQRWGSTLFVAVRTTGDAASFAPRLRQIVREMDPELPVSRLRTFETYIAEDLATERALSGLLAALGALALGLSAIGVFGVMSLIVAARKREIGVRLAIGARPAQVSVMILGRTLALAAAGAALGLPAAAALARVMRAFLFEMSPFDARVYGGAAAFLLAVAALAALLPALRAASVDPMTTLRQEG